MALPLPETPRGSPEGEARGEGEVHIGRQRVVVLTRCAPVIGMGGTSTSIARVHHSLSPRGTSGERAGERGSFLRLGRCLAAPLPHPLPTPSSWGEGILCLRWWWHQDAPIEGSRLFFPVHFFFPLLNFLRHGVDS